MNLPERFWVKIDTSGECWVWLAAKTAAGYGVFNFGSKTTYAHRLTYIDRYGLPADGLELDHLCENKWCVNPDHLEAVTHKENVQRGSAGNQAAADYQRAKTSCPKGHPYSGKDKRGYRVCGECNRLRARARSQSKSKVS